jgi:hypothetical protein
MTTLIRKRHIRRAGLIRTFPSDKQASTSSLAHKSPSRSSKRKGNFMSAIFDTNGHYHFVVIEGPKPDDAAFFVRWLSSAARAQTLWISAKENHVFYEEIMQLDVIGKVDFGMEAIEFIKDLRPCLTCFILDLDAACGVQGEMFACMVDLGFFSWSTTHYKMAIPESLTIASLKSAMRRLIATKYDEDDGTRPECLLNVLTHSDAKFEFSRLRSALKKWC